MNIWRTFVIAFWVFVIGGLLWSFYNYNNHVSAVAAQSPDNKHYFYNMTITPTPTPSAPLNLHAADVRQISYSVEEGVPNSGSFTITVTLKNIGNVKATGIQLSIKPFHGAQFGNRDGHILFVSDDDPVAQYGEWLNFPDLDPGQSFTQTRVFVGRDNLHPGSNPNPQIIFETDKPNP